MATGVSVVDDRLGGGVPARSPFAIVAPPESRSELLVDRLTAQRQTLYVRTARSEASVTQAFDRTDVDIGSPMVAYAEPDSGLHAHWRVPGPGRRVRLAARGGPAGVTPVVAGEEVVVVAASRYT